MPDFLNKEIQEYIKMIYGIGENDRIFDFTKSFLHHEMKRGSAAAGVKKLSLHQLRHSHVSLLISMGFTAVAIAKRVGHESIDITYRYAHMFPSEQTEMADKLNIERG
jgi:integrase